MSQIGVPTKNMEEVLAGDQQSSFILGQNLKDDEAQRLKSRPTSDLTPIPTPYRVGVGQPDLPAANTKTGTLTPSTAKDPNGNRIIDSDLSFSTLTTGGPFDVNQTARARAIKASKVENATVLGAPMTSGIGSGAFSGGTPGGLVAATEIVQDLTFTAKVKGTQGNAVSIEYTDTETAGAEVVTVVGNAISVGMESGASTATMIFTALQASLAAMGLVNVIISGSPTAFQNDWGLTYMAGGAGCPTDGYGDTLNGHVTVAAINRTGSRNNASINVISRPGDTNNGGFLF